MTGPPVGAGLGGQYRGEAAGHDLGTIGDFISVLNGSQVCAVFVVVVFVCSLSTVV